MSRQGGGGSISKTGNHHHTHLELSPPAVNIRQAAAFVKNEVKAASPQSIIHGGIPLVG